MPGESIETSTLSLNTYYDFDRIGWLKPYVGAGLGYAWNEIGINSIGTTTFQTVHDDNWRFAYNLMAGIVIPASEGSRFTIGYRWLHEDVGINCGTGVSCSGNLNSSSIDVGYVINL